MDATKWMHFLIEDGKLLKEYNDIWNKVSKSNLSKLIADPSTIKKFLKSKIKSYGNEATDFKEIPKIGSNYIA